MRNLCILCSAFVDFVVKFLTIYIYVIYNWKVAVNNVFGLLVCCVLSFGWQ